MSDNSEDKKVFYCKGAHFTNDPQTGQVVEMRFVADQGKETLNLRSLLETAQLMLSDQVSDMRSVLVIPEDGCLILRPEKQQ